MSHTVYDVKMTRVLSLSDGDLCVNAAEEKLKREHRKIKILWSVNIWPKGIYLIMIIWPQ